MPGSIGHPLISVVIPTYNRLSLIQKSIASVLAQTYSEWELIVVNDGSTDGTSQLIRSVNDSRISIVELPHTGHIGSLFNSGVRASNGEWVAFLASDDIWMPDKLELQLNALKESGTRWCYSNFELINDLGRTIPVKGGKYRPISGWIIKELLTTEASVTMCSVIMQRSLFEEVGGFNTDARLLYRGDYEFGLRVALKAEVTALEDILVQVLEHAGRSTNGIKDAHERTALAYEIFLDTKPIKELKLLAKTQQASHLAEAASLHLSGGRYILAGKQLLWSLSNGAGIKKCLSALHRGIRGRIIKHREQN